MKGASLILAGLAGATPLEVQERQSCPAIHVFGARETTVAPGFGTSQGLVQMVQQAYPGTTADPIAYPACGGQSSCGGASYDSSAQQGTAAVVSAVQSLNQRCPDTKIVLIGYSQVYIFLPVTTGLWIGEGYLCGDWLTIHPQFRAARSWTTPSAAVPAPH